MSLKKNPDSSCKFGPKFNGYKAHKLQGGEWEKEKAKFHIRALTLGLP